MILTGVGAASYLGGAAPPAGAFASVSISRNWPPTSIVSPSSAKYFWMTPECYDKISTVTLSVSIRATISSASTNSPTSKQRQSETRELEDSRLGELELMITYS